MGEEGGWVGVFKKIKDMEKVYIFMKMETNMMDNGKMINNMENLEN